MRGTSCSRSFLGVAALTPFERAPFLTSFLKGLSLVLPGKEAWQQEGKPDLTYFMCKYHVIVNILKGNVIYYIIQSCRKYIFLV